MSRLGLRQRNGGVREPRPARRGTAREQLIELLPPGFRQLLAPAAPSVTPDAFPQLRAVMTGGDA